MTDAEITACFDNEYGDGGIPKLAAAAGKIKQKTAFEYFADYCRDQCCLTDPAKIKELWPAHRAKVKEAERTARIEAKADAERIRAKLAAQARARREGR